ncbi:ASCIZ zinc finger protein [Arctopsyche grandis]|uniref:ASCIZ zinc finger protein n=1 Tax=Arctopsyche grandis TaxID=121162 RepID=UPI00406D6D76
METVKMDLKQMLSICPTESELSQIVTENLCSEPGCGSAFKKLSNLQMHLVKHHKIGQFEPKTKSARYFCPRDDCVYNISFSNGKSFNEKRLLKQHFMKVHALKNYSCDKCGLKTSLASTYKRHIQNCGVKFSCGACGWEYNSNESLLVHLMRKHPNIHQAYMQNKNTKQSGLHARKEKNSVDRSNNIKIIRNVRESQDSIIQCEIPDVIYRSTPSDVECTKKILNVLNDISTTHVINEESLIENKEFGHKNFENNSLTNKEIEVNIEESKLVELYNNIKLEHNYVTFIDCKNDNIKEQSYKNLDCIDQLNNEIHTIQYVNVVEQNEGDKLNISLVLAEKNPSYVLVPINLFNKNNFSNVSTVNENISSCSSNDGNWITLPEEKQLFQPHCFDSKSTNAIEPMTKRVEHKDTCTQTALKLRKKSKISSVNKSSVETQTFNQMWNPSKTKNKIKHVDAMTQSVHLKKQKHKQMMLRQLDLTIMKNKRRFRNIQRHCSIKNIHRKRNECNVNKVCESSNDINSDFNVESNELYTENNQNHIKISKSSKNEVKLRRFGCIEAEKRKFPIILKSHSETLDAIMNDDLNNESKIDCKITDDSSNTFTCNSTDFNCQFDYEDTITQSSDIETQTALDELLYSNTSKCDDIQDIFSELISLSDIQTQTTWPLNYADSILEPDELTCAENKSHGSMLISTETQTTDDIAQDQNSLDFATSNYVYEMDKSSPFFEGTSAHFCFKETQTCFCFLDSPKFEDSLNHKIIQDVSLLESAQNDISKPTYVCSRNLNDNSKLSLCASTSAETQTQFSFENSQFLSRKSDVLLSCSTIETQTCFEGDYLEDIIDVNRAKDI